MNMNADMNYRLPLWGRTLVIIAVMVLAVLTSLGVVPLAKLMNVPFSKLQGAGFEPTFRTMSIVILYSASQFLLIWLVMRLIHKRPFASLGFRRPFWAPLLIGTGAGILIKGADTLLLCLFGKNAALASNIPAGTPLLTVAGYFLLWLLFLLTLNSLKEELVFRAYPIEQFNDRKKFMPLIIVLISLVFSAVHHIIEPFSLSAFISRFIIAVFFSYVYFRTRSIWLVAGLHNGTNFLGFLLGGQWTSGGLLRLTFDYPSETVVILIDIFMMTAATVLFHLIWKRQGDRLRAYFSLPEKQA